MLRNVADEPHKSNEPMLIGELARASGLTVRTLQYYDRLGLLTPMDRGQNGYRLYGPAEAATLYRIRALRMLGLSLAEIASVLKADEPTTELSQLVGSQLTHVRTQRTAMA